MSQTLEKRLFLASALFLWSISLFMYGMAVIRWHVWPYSLVTEAWTIITSLKEEGEIAPEDLFITPPDDAPRKRFVRYRPDKQADGYYVFMGYDQDKGVYAAWLLDQTGQRLHRWLLDYDVMDPDGPLGNSDMPHGFAVLPDGSVIVNFDHGDVMARLDSCSQPVWTRSGVYHHSLQVANDGSYWTWRGEGTSQAQYHYLVNFDPETGATITEIGLIEDIIKPLEAQAMLFGVRPDHDFPHFNKTPVKPGQTDLFHPNDVDVLSTELAPLFPDFEPGDLLLSFRINHLVAVLDSNTRRIKWWSHGPWRFQHDPDFTSDGKISVFSNNTGAGRSEIIKMDPTSLAVSNELYDGELEFYTDTMGKHQYLPNGNLLVTIPAEGRILEVTQKGDKIMEFNNLSTSSPDKNVHVENGVWVPANYFDVLPDCPGLQ